MMIEAQTVPKSARHRPKVKTGCRTCKIRKLKCDEAFPSCNRCVSTGRQCAGYGIWGGGGGISSRSTTTTDAVKVVSPLQQALMPSYNYMTILSEPVKNPQVIPIGATSIELENFDWLRTYSVYKLPGSCPSGFWSQLLLQASVTEPAVWHAVMAMSSSHKANSLRGTQSKQDAPGYMLQAEQVALGHYVRSIKFLQPHFETRDKSSVRTMLITCIVFLGLELLRGHIEVAEAHLENGLRIVSMDRADQHSAVVSEDYCGRSPVDDQIQDTLLRFRVQLDIYRLLTCNKPITRPPRPKKRTPARFDTLKEAWMALDSLTDRIIALHESVRTTELQGSTCVNHNLQCNRSSISEALEHWRKIYTLSKTRLVPGGNGGYLRVYNVLLLNHSMLSILLETALNSQDEMKYDWHNSKFLSIVEYMVTLWKTNGEHPDIDESFEGATSGSARSILDAGAIAPLYFTALKCRVHRIRLQAIMLLELSGHREGFWDSILAARAARRVMEAEEGDFYDDVDLDDDFDLVSYPSREDLSLPLIPASRRLHTGLNQRDHWSPSSKLSFIEPRR